MAEDMNRQLMLAKAEALRRGLSASPAQPSSFDPGMMQLEASAAFDETQQRRMDAMQAPQGPAQAGLPAMMPGRAPQPEMRPQAPPPADHGAPPIPGPVGMPMSSGSVRHRYGEERARVPKGRGRRPMGCRHRSDRDNAGHGRNRARRCAARQRLHGRSVHQPDRRSPGDRPGRWEAPSTLRTR